MDRPTFIKCLNKLRQVADNSSLEQFKGYIYEELILLDAVRSCFWMKTRTVRQFVLSVMVKELWDDLHILDADSIDLLCKAVERNGEIIAILQPSNPFENTIVCFRNALYILQEDRWYLHSDPNRPNHYRATWFIDSDLDTQTIPISGNLIHRNFANCSLLKLFRDQGFYDEAQLQHILTVGMGQFLHTLCPLLEFLPRSVVLSGPLTSGKSTFIETASQIVSNEKTYPHFSSFCTPFSRCWCAPYVSDIKLLEKIIGAQTPKLFCLYGTNDCISEKMQFLVCNKQVEWIEFTHPIHIRPDFGQEIEKQLGTIFRMANLCYLEAVRNHQLSKLEQVKQALDLLVSMPIEIYEHILGRYL